MGGSVISDVPFGCCDVVSIGGGNVRSDRRDARYDSARS